MNISPDLKVGRRVGSPSNRLSNTNNIHINNIIGSAEPLPTTETNESKPDSLIVPEALRTDDNVNIRHFEAKPEDLFKLDVDVNFLKHVIKILITNHHITTDHKDLSDILMYFGDVDIKAEQQHIKSRGVKNKRLCGNVDIDEVIEISLFSYF
jgi:hypothetical protein